MTKRRDSEAKKYWQKVRLSARLGDLDSMLRLASACGDGLTSRDGEVVVQRSLRSAVFWYRKAAIHGDAGAQLELANCLSAGEGVRKDEAEALHWYKRAVRQGYASAASNIAILYQERGNMQRAFFWFRRAVEMGDGDALVDVGRLSYIGLGHKQDSSLAVRCFRGAVKSDCISEAGREDAMYWLGIAYMEGKGVGKSLRSARNWLEKANADGDHEKAEEALGNLSLTPPPNPQKAGEQKDGKGEE